MHRLTATLVALAAGATLAAQQRPVFKSGVDLIHLDVSVLDGNRRPVKGLTVGDFTVLEDGRPQPVSAFSAIDLPDPPPAPVAWMRDVAPDVRRNSEVTERRLVVVVMDDATIPFEQTMIRSAREIGRLAIEQLGPNDLACVVFTRDNRNAQEFTNDRARLLRAIESFQYGGRQIGLPAGAPPGFQLAESNAFYQSIGTLARVAETLASVPDRRKAVIFVSVGVPADLGTVAQIVMAGGDNPGEAEIGPMLRRIFDYMSDTYRKAQVANVNIYSVSPAGVGGMDQLIQSERWKGRFVPPYETALNYGDFLNGIAANTGGRAFTDRNEFGTALTSIFQENGSYYLLGYAAPNPAADGKHRRVEVRVNRPGLTVRTRTGYYSAKAREEDAKAAAPLVAALQGLLPRADVALDVMAAPFAIPAKVEAGVAVVLTVHEDLPERPARMTKDVDLQITAFTQDGVQRGSQGLKTKVTLRAGAAGRAQYEVLSHITLRPGRYQLRLSAQTAGQTGSVYYDIDIPDFGRLPLSVSGLVLTADPRPVSSPLDPIRAFVPISPTARRDFAATDRVTAFARVYQGGRDPVLQTTLAASIIDATGAVRVNRSQLVSASDITGPPSGRMTRSPQAPPQETVSSDRSIDFQFDLPMRSLPPGEYLFRLEASTARASMKREVRFRVR